MNPEFILNITDVERGLGLDRSDPEDRASIVQLNDILIDALELLFERGIPKTDSLIWLDTDIGEGSIFRALSSDIPTMLTFEFDTRDHFEASIEEMNEVKTKFRPDVLLIPVLNAAQDMGKPSLSSTVSRMARSISPIDKHIGIYDFANTFDVNMAWDIRKPRGEWPDPMLQSENALRIISLFQDANLDPQYWIMNLPSVRVVAETLTARTHIDDRTDVMPCFTLDTLFPITFAEKNAPQTLPKVVESAVTVVAKMPGNPKIVVGPETYASCMIDVIRGDSSADHAAQAIASRLSAVSKTLRLRNIPVV